MVRPASQEPLSGLYAAEIGLSLVYANTSLECTASRRFQVLRNLSQRLNFQRTLGSTPTSARNVPCLRLLSNFNNFTDSNSGCVLEVLIYSWPPLAPLIVSGLSHKLTAE